MIFHIVDKDYWLNQVSSGEYLTRDLDSEGFIHCSDIQKVTHVANQIYKGIHNLILLCIDEDKIHSKVKWEDLYDLNYDYPHIYGPLNIDAVISIHEFEPNEEGFFSIPNDLI